MVTGTSGRIGQAISQNLASVYEVIGLDRIPGEQTTVIGDITDQALLEDLLAGCEGVVHSAALHAPHVGQFSKEAFVKTNVIGTQCLLAAARNNGCRRFVFTSSTSIYGDALLPQDGAVWVTETLNPIPRDIYDETKFAAEQACREADSDQLRCVVLRMSRCFPEPEPEMTLYRLYRGVDSRDVADAHYLALTKPLPRFDIFNISAASPFKRDDLQDLLHHPFALISTYFPWAKALFEANKWKKPERIDRVYVIKKAIQQLNFQPKYNFKQRVEALYPGFVH